MITRNDLNPGAVFTHKSGWTRTIVGNDGEWICYNEKIGEYVAERQLVREVSFWAWVRKNSIEYQKSS